MYQGDSQKCKSTCEQDGDACGWAEEKRKPRGQHRETKHNSCQVRWVYRKKKVREFPVPSRDVTTKFSLGGNNDVITDLFLPRGSLVSDIPAGEGKLVNLFLRCALVFSSYADVFNLASLRPEPRPWVALLYSVLFSSTVCIATQYTDC
jgi:hypothetical protein